MDERILIAYLERYKKQAPKNWENEKVKWAAVACFQKAWNGSFPDFYTKLKTSLSKADLLFASRPYPKDSILKLARADSDAVERMFAELFDESNGADNTLQRIARFKSEAERLYKNNYIFHCKYK